MEFNKIYSVVGSRGTGKTPLIMGGEDEQGMAKIFLDKGMSTLILDTLDHPKYRHVQTLLPKNYSQCSDTPALYRTLASPDDMQHVLKSLSNVWNTFIVFEDAYKYIGTELNRDIRRVIADSKQQNNCLLFMFSCWAWTPLDLVRQANYFIIFKCADSPEVRGRTLGGCYAEVIQAYSNVMAGKARYIVVDSGI